MFAPGAAPTDEELAAAAVAGDETAFETLVERHQGRAYGLACRLVGADAAPDALQEAFLQVHRKLPTFRGEARFATWLYRIVTNAALMQARRRARRPAESLEEFLPRFDSEGGHAGTPEQLRAAAQAESVVERRQLAARAREAIARLPEPYRAAFVLRDLEEIPTAQVAEILGLEPATVRQRVHRARLMLRGWLSDLVGVKP
jgi:RNA polymerase sigma-70 factor (ECF subfamily)